MTTEEIRQIIAGGETLYTEFKSATAHPDALAAALVSFLNTEGGVLLLGVEDAGAVTGVDDADAARQRVDQILANNVTPRATAYVETVAYAGQTLLKVVVRRGLDRPYHTQRGQCFVRTNAGKRLASREEMRRMYLDVRAFYYDESAVLETGLDDVDVHTFDDFLSLAYGYPADEARTAAERARLLRNLKAMRGDQLTVAGLLFFGRRPQDYLPTARVDFARFAGTLAGEMILDRKELAGRLPQQLEGIEEVLRLHLRNSGVIRDFEPEARYEMPLEMPREALINALVHRDYSLAAAIRVLMFDDRLEVHSPGRLPNGVTVENIRAGIHPSTSSGRRVERNPIILSLMAKLGLMTRLGTGILRILRLAGEAGLREPGLVESESEFVVTLYRPGSRASAPPSPPLSPSTGHRLWLPQGGAADPGRRGRVDGGRCGPPVAGHAGHRQRLPALVTGSEPGVSARGARNRLGCHCEAVFAEAISTTAGIALLRASQPQKTLLLRNLDCHCERFLRSNQQRKS